MTRCALLYTEMIVAQAIVFGPRERILAFHPNERPLSIQLGGSDPLVLAQACQAITPWNYDEINLNVGCPSHRVQSGSFGACLMKEPKRVARIIREMRCATSLPITVKCRTGVDDQDEAKTLPLFIEHLQEAGVQTFIIHARRAWLDGLSPEENRSLPPLNYSLVHAIKARFPHLTIILNGGLVHPEDGLSHVPPLDGVMLGRSMIKSPYLLTQVDRLFFHRKEPAMSRLEVARAFLKHIGETPEGRNDTAWPASRHMLGLMDGLPGARIWRRALAAHNGLTVLKETVDRLADQMPTWSQTA